MMIYDIVMENEKALRGEKQVRQGIMRIWQVMQECVEKGFHQEGILPGGLEVKRRAPEIYSQLMQSADTNDATEFMDWVSELDVTFLNLNKDGFDASEIYRPDPTAFTVKAVGITRC